VSPVNYIRIWEQVRPTNLKERVRVDPWTKFPELRPPEGFEDFKAEIQRYLVSTGGVMMLQARHQNEFTASMASAALTMLGFGCYNQIKPGETRRRCYGMADLKAMAELLDPLLALLETSTDTSNRVKPGSVDPAMFAVSEEASSLVETKLRYLPQFNALFTPC